MASILSWTSWISSVVGIGFALYASSCSLREWHSAWHKFPLCTYTHYAVRKYWISFGYPKVTNYEMWFSFLLSLIRLHGLVCAKFSESFSVIVLKGLRDFHARMYWPCIFIVKLPRGYLCATYHLCMILWEVQGNDGFFY